MPSRPFLVQRNKVLRSKLHRPKWHFGRGSVQISYIGDRKTTPVKTGKTGRSLKKEDGVGLGAGEALCLHKEDHSWQHRQALPAPSLACPPQARQGAARLSSCFSSSGLGGPDSQEPGPLRGSQAVQTLTHSCLEQRRGLPPPFLLREAGMPTGSGGD